MTARDKMQEIYEDFLTAQNRLDQLAEDLAILEGDLYMALKQWDKEEASK